MVGTELVALYADPEELVKHARVVDLEEAEANEFNLNVPRYVDTFEPEPRIALTEAIGQFRSAKKRAEEAETELGRLLRSIGYGP